MSPRPSPRRGAALLIAMIILTLVSTLASMMVWQQHRAIAVEEAERARTQATWILTGALDWARLILSEDAKSGGNVDHLGEPWAVPLAEARLSAFLAADKNNNADTGDGLDAFLAGSITDAQARYNLHNLVDGEGKIVPEQLAVLTRLCEIAGVSGGTALRIAEGLRQSREGGADAAIPPQTFDQLVWLGGIAPADLKRLEPYAVLLPLDTPVNVNTAPREVLAAAVAGLDLGTAERIVQQSKREPFRKMDDVTPLLPTRGEGTKPPNLSVDSKFFEVRGRIRLGDRVVEERSLVRREGRVVTTLQRERHSSVASAQR